MLKTKDLLSLFIGACMLGAPLVASAAPLPQLTTTPVVIDDKAKARDILQEKVTITNATDHKLEIYPSVNNVAPKDGAQQFTPAQGADQLSDSLANWIELSRGVIALSPGETREVPFIIHVNFNAVPSMYHAEISFFEGTTRAEAEAAGALSTVTVNLEVQQDVKEILQLDKFATGKFFLAGDDVRFDYQLENIGNQELQPHGEIRIYDRKGAEVASVDVNKDGKAVSPEQMSQLASVWTAAQGLGQYKALLTVYYGKNQTASVQDTVFFWIIPWKQLLMLFVAGLIAIIFAAFYVHKRLDARHAPAAVAVASHEGPGATPIFARLPQIHLPKIRIGALFAVVTVPTRFAIRTIGSVARLKRGERRLPAATPAPIQAPQTIAPTASVPVSEPAPVAYVRAEPAAPTAASHTTIDLKNLRSTSPEHVVSEGHVIDLKKLR